MMVRSPSADELTPGIPPGFFFDVFPTEEAGQVRYC